MHQTRVSTLDSFTIQNNQDGTRQLQQRLQQYRNHDVRVTMESTANMWIVLYDMLTEQGLDVSLANTLKTRVIAEAKIKYDKLDAAVLADLAGADLVSKCYVPDKNTRQVRDLIRHRIDIVQSRTVLKNKIHSILDKYCISYDGTLFTDKGIAWLRSQQLNWVDAR